MIPRHGFSAALFGLLTFNLGRGGSRGAFVIETALAPGGFGTIFTFVFDSTCAVKCLVPMVWELDGSQQRALRWTPAIVVLDDTKKPDVFERRRCDVAASKICDLEMGADRYSRCDPHIQRSQKSAMSEFGLAQYFPYLEQHRERAASSLPQWHLLLMLCSSRHHV